ncbi:unnamed protein product, partial [Symbiodinium sp. KB8]
MADAATKPIAWSLPASLELAREQIQEEQGGGGPWSLSKSTKVFVLPRGQEEPEFKSIVAVGDILSKDETALTELGLKLRHVEGEDTLVVYGRGKIAKSGGIPQAKKDSGGSKVTGQWTPDAKDELAFDAMQHGTKHNWLQ